MAERTPAADMALREEALDPRRSFIVQAPAGSGKTELLIQRLLVLLAHAEQPEEIAAITFTRKAAGEMRLRLLEALEKAAADALENSGENSAKNTGEGPAGPPQPVHIQLQGRRARAVLERDRERGWNLLESPGRLRIQTIDSFCAALARQSPLGSGLGEHPGISGDPSALYQAAAQATLAGIESEGVESEAVGRLLLHLDNHQPRVAGLLVAMLARRDQWLRHMEGAGNPTLSRNALEAELSALVSETLSETRASLQQAMIATNAGDGSQSGEAPVDAMALMRGAARQAVRARSESPIAILESLEELPPPGPGALPQWKGLAELMTTGAGEWRSRLTKNEGFPVDKGSGDVGELRARKAEMQGILTALAGLPNGPQLAGQLRDTCNLPSAGYSEEQWALMEAVLILLPRAVRHLRQAFRSMGEVDYVEISLAASRAGSPGSGGHPAEGAFPDDGLRHLLVDEFQDTSRSQYELFSRIVSGWPGDGSRTLFLVGDPMQSIYRFREADVGLFLRVRREGLGALDLAAITLTVNFRSSAPLVEWVNGAFAAILPEEEDVQTGAVPFTQAEAHEGSAHAGSGGELPGGEPAVEVIPFLAVGEDGRSRADAAEADAVADRIASALENRPEETVAVLVRARTHLAEILPVLHRRGIPVRAVEIERLAGRPAIQDLLSLTRALLHPGDRVAWLSVLRAPWCGMTLADLLGLAGDFPGQPIWEAITDATRTAALSADGRERLHRVAEVLGPSLAQRRRPTLRRWVEGAWLALGGPACVPPEDLPNANTYFDLLERLEGQRQALDPGVLAEKLQGLFAAPRMETGSAIAGTGNGAGVEVMSIHRAKGLEFDTVILPGLGRAPRGGDPPLLRWVERSNPVQEGGGLVMAPLHESGGETDPIYGLLARIERERERHETGRLLYVAVTRAKSRLILLGQARAAGDGPGLPHVHSLLRRLWVAVNDRFTEAWEHIREAAGEGEGEPVLQDMGREARPAQVQVIRRLVSGWSLPELPPRLPGWRAAGEDMQAEKRAETTEEGAEGEEGEGIEFSWAGETARLVGTLTHRLLYRIANQGSDLAGAWSMEEGDLQVERVRRALAGLGVPREKIAEAAEKVLRAVKGTFAHEKGRWLMQPHAGARSEYSVTGLREGVPVHAVIDRTFVDGGVRWIVDFKTGSHAGSDKEAFLDREQERYRGQLEGYAEIMARLDPGKPIKLGLYFPLLGGWREWEAEVPEVPEDPQGALGDDLPADDLPADDLPKETP